MIRIEVFGRWREMGGRPARAGALRGFTHAYVLEYPGVLDATPFPSTVDVDDSVVGRSRWCESALTSSSPSKKSRLVGEPTCFYIRCSLCKLLKINSKEPVCKSHFCNSYKCPIFNLLRVNELRLTLLKHVEIGCFAGILPATNSSTPTSSHGELTKAILRFVDPRVLCFPDCGHAGGNLEANLAVLRIGR
jgi:hypothetical protein